MAARIAVLAALAGTLILGAAGPSAAEGESEMPAIYPDGRPGTPSLDDALDEHILRQRQQYRERLFREAEQRRARADAERTRAEQQARRAAEERQRRERAAQVRTRLQETQESGFFSRPSR